MLIDGNLLWVIIGFFVAVIIAGGIAGAIDEEIDYDYSPAPLVGFIVSLALIVAGFNGLVFLGSSSGNNSQDSITETTNTFITEPLGLTPEQTYPLVLGGRPGSYSETDLEASYGLFHGYVSLHAVSGSTVTVSFEYEGRTSSLEVPISKVNFYQKIDTAPSVKFYFTGLPQLQQTTVTTYAPCHFQFVNLTTACVQGELVSSETTPETLDPDTIRRGLPPMVMQYIDTVDITLTPDMYNQLIGKIE